MSKGFGAVIAGVLAVPLLLGSALVVIIAAEEDAAPSASAVSDLSAVPQEFQQLVLAAGQQCAEVPASLIAAQIEAESGWRADAVSPVGAQGLTQFMPGTWGNYGVDGDADGVADPFNPADAIPAQANFMCALADELRGVAEDSGAPLLELILAGYNAGPGAVRQYGGIPPYAETQGYVTKILALMQDKYGSIASTPGGSTSGGWVEPVANPVRGTPFKKYGSSWAWKGWHTGADYPAPIGTRIGAAGPGTVAEINAGGSYGTHVILDHGTIDGDRVQSLYAHMSGLAAGLKVGDTVAPGTAVGYVGLTGNTNGPHVHMEVRLNWTGGANDAEFTDPWAWIDAHSGPATDGSGGAAAALAFATDQIGVPYSWGGGTLTQPSTGIGQGSNTVGWDCSSLVRAAIYAATGTKLDRVTQNQVKQGEAVTGSPQAGDLVFYQLNGSGWDHVGIATGEGTMIHAPRTGKPVAEVSITEGYYGPQTTRTIRRVL